MRQISRRHLLAASAAAAVFAPAIVRAAAPVLRVGYQKYGNLLLLKASGILEGKLKPLGTRVEWKQFVSGPPLMEALAAGAIDVGSAGETPPIFAQAAGAPIVYLGAEPPAPAGEAILVRQDSPLHSLADLRGKKVAFNKGSNVHVLYLRALERAGLDPKEVTAIYLNPADGRSAFERGSVDAWVIWDPYLAAAQATGHTRTLADGTGLAANHQFYLGSRRFGDRQVLDVFRDAVAAIDTKTVGNPGAAAATLSPETGLPADVLAVALKRQSWDVQPMDGSLVAKQQAIADQFFKLGLIPKAIKVADALA
jgi:sulfonate transport system substrate-binding protein